MTRVAGGRHGRRPPVWWLRVAPLLLLVATVVGAVVLWPGTPVRGPGAPPAPQRAQVLSTQPCGPRCLLLQVSLHGRVVPLEQLVLGPGQPLPSVGARVLVTPVAASGAGAARWAYDAADRTRPLALLAVVLAAVVIAVARARGLAALAGLAASFVVLRVFLLPALLAGRAPVPVAVVASMAVLLIVLYVAHGVSDSTTVALLGSAAAVGLAAALSTAATALVGLTGTGSDQALALQAVVPGLRLQGLVLAGVVLGSLGVLNDVTISQSALVQELRAASPSAGRRATWAAAMRVGRHHVASAIYTLVLAYAGAALPLLVLVTATAQGWAATVSGQDVAQEVVRTCVGAICLVLAVPLTTLLAVLVPPPAPAD